MIEPYWKSADGRHVIYNADCLQVLPELEAGSVDAVLTDPPYELAFMGKKWDCTGIAYSVEMWKEVLRVLKPGGHLLAFGGTRTHHRMVCAIEDAGFEIRDEMQWLYGSGFPKSLDVSKAIDKAAGAKREVVGSYMGATNIGKTTDGKRGYGHDGQSTGGTDRTVFVTAPATPAARRWSGWGTALKPACEPICVARKPLIGTVAENVLTHGTGAINVDACRVGDFVNTTPSGVDRRNATLAEQGYRPNSYQMGETMPGGKTGRWPANVLHDGSEEVLAAFAVFGEKKSCNSPSNAKCKSNFRPSQGSYQPQGPIYPGDTGTAARFFYTAKASRSERGDGNSHPTVKPINLIRYLVRLVTPPEGVVLDMFAGSGTTGVACVLEGMRFIGIEISEAYCEIARKRIKRELSQPMLPFAAPEEKAEQATMFDETEGES